MMNSLLSHSHVLWLRFISDELLELLSMLELCSTAEVAKAKHKNLKIIKRKV